MKKTQKSLLVFLGITTLLSMIFLTKDSLDLPKESNQASVITSTPKITYNLTPSKNSESFTFDYADDTTTKQKEAFFDLPIIPFDDEVAKKELGDTFVDFGPIRDAWNYPVRENAYQNLKETPKAIELPSNNKKGSGTVKNLDPGTDLGVYNCRANTQVTGYFQAYFEDVALDTNQGYDDPTYGAGRRAEACQVLQDISELLMMNNTNTTPDIIFDTTTRMPAGALAAASAYFGYYTTNEDNGSLHKHIISRQDPTPGQGEFDALIITNWNGVNWDVDSNLNTGTYDMYSVLYHEVLHTLGFRGLLPAVIPQTNITQRHDNFDKFSYKDNTLQNPFLTPLTSLLQMPTGAPSPWFVTNQVVYQGIKNYVGATPDEVQPIYSPTNWQQGSSLSHFDMTRAPGETFVMHPSIGMNTERSINTHEEEVLCHLGYQVENMCEEVTPVAVDDVVIFTPGVGVCIDLLSNDINPGGTVDDLGVRGILSSNTQPGDTFTFYNLPGCNGPAANNFLNTRSFLFNSTTNTSPRVLTYINKDLNSSRVSLAAKISISPSCESVVDEDEYVCNGDFEMGVINISDTMFYNQAFRCPDPDWNASYRVPFWCEYNFTPDLLSTEHPVVPNSSLIGNYIAHLWQSPSNPYRRESINTKLKESLIPGLEYTLSFDVVYTNNLGGSVSFWLDHEYIVYPTTPQEMIFNQILPTVGEWHHFEESFVANDNYEFLIAGSAEFSSEFNFILDNISIRPSDSPPPPPVTGSITGTLYHDQNQNSNQDSTEPGLPGIQIGLYQSGINLPIQTNSTQNFPNQGEYTFNNLQDGTYYTAIVTENIYPSITEPVYNSGLVVGHLRVNTATVNNGQTSTNNNFGVTLNGDTVILGCTNPLAVNYNPLATTDDGSCTYPNTNLIIKKQLIDGSTSWFDNYITWRIQVLNQGPTQATNIQIQDTLPSGLQYHSQDPLNPNESYNPSTSIYSIPDLNVGEVTYIDITTKVLPKACGLKINTASLLSLDQTDTHSQDNSSFAVFNTHRACKDKPMFEVE